MNINQVIENEELLEKKFSKNATKVIAVGISACILVFILQVLLGPLTLLSNDEIIGQAIEIALSFGYIGIPFLVAKMFYKSINKEIDFNKTKRKYPKSPAFYILGAVGCGYITILTMQTLAPDFLNKFLPQSDISVPQSPIGILLFYIKIAVVPAIIEEWAFRGVLLKNLLPYGKGGAIIISSLLFGLAHLSPAQAIFTTIFGILLALCYEYTNSLFIPMVMHFLNNFISATASIFADNTTVNLIISLITIGFMIVGMVALIYYPKNGIAHKRISLCNTGSVGYKFNVGQYLIKFFTNVTIIPYTIIFLLLIYLVYYTV